LADLNPLSLRVLETRLPARFIERPNKYLAIVSLAGKPVKAFVPNPGRMRELFLPGVEVLLRPHSGFNPFRKTDYDLIAVRHRRRFVLIDSGVPNKFLKYLLSKNLLPEMEGWTLVRPEYKWGNSQFDFLLEREGQSCLLEAKCCTYVVKDLASGIWECRFPDAPTTRGTRHVRELIEAKKQGYRSVVMILVQGVGAERFRPNWETDPDFSETFYEAKAAGVETYARVLRFAGKRIHLCETLPVLHRS
jgi:sugar fermentation stimulation protein A